MLVFLLAVFTALTSPRLPNPLLTPGATLPVSAAQICVKGYAGTARNVPQSVKNAAFKEYGITNHVVGDYEIDHLISLELGGSNALKNLWPQSYRGATNAHDKDKLENKLHALVCSNQLSLAEAQQAIASNWILAAKKYLP